MGGPDPTTGCPKKRDSESEDSHVTMEAETGGTWPRAWGQRECPEPGRVRKDLLLEPLEGARP